MGVFELLSWSENVLMGKLYLMTKWGNLNLISPEKALFKHGRWRRVTRKDSSGFDLVPSTLFFAFAPPQLINLKPKKVEKPKKELLLSDKQ